MSETAVSISTLVHASQGDAPLGTAVQLRGVHKTFAGGNSGDASGGGVVAVDGVDLHVAPGEFVALLGPSGCGKSTLLRMIAGLDQPNAGAVLLDGQPAMLHHGAGDRTAYVFQDAHLLPWRDVLGNVMLPLELLRVPAGERRAAATAAVAQVGLSEALHRYPNQLSGGMRMRVSLARALVTNPKLLLLDEPFAALDEITRQNLDEQLYGLWWERRMTVLFVTHAIAEAAYLAQRAVVLTRRPARVVEDRRVALPVERPGALRGTAEFAAQTAVLYDALRRGGAWA